MGSDQQNPVRQKLVAYIAELEDRLNKKLAAIAALEDALEGGGHNSDSNHTDTHGNKGKEKESEPDTKPRYDDEKGSSPDEFDSGLELESEAKSDDNQTVPSSKIDEMERKYVITDVTLFIKSCCVLVVVILLFFLHSFLSTNTLLL